MSFVYSIIFKIYTLNTILSSFRALKHNNERDQRVLLSERRRQINSSLQIWLCWFIWIKLSTVVDFLFSWIWFYWQIKSFVLFTFILTSKQTANALFNDALKPTLQPYEDKADAMFALLEDSLVIGSWVLTDVIYLTIKNKIASIGFIRRYFDLDPPQPPTALKTKRVVRRTTGPVVRQRKNMIANTQNAPIIQTTDINRSKTIGSARPNVVLRRPQPARKSDEGVKQRNGDESLINSKPTFMSTPKAKTLHISQQGTQATPYIPGTMPRTPPSVRLTRSQTRANTAATNGDKGGDNSSNSSSSSDEEPPPPPPKPTLRNKPFNNLGVDSIANMDRKRNASNASLKSVRSTRSDEQPSYKVLRRADPSMKTSNSDSESSDSDSDSDSETHDTDAKMQDVEEESTTTRNSNQSSGGENRDTNTSNIPRKKRIVTAWNKEKPQTRAPRGAIPLRKPTAQRGRVLRRPPTRGRGRGRGA